MPDSSITMDEAIIVSQSKKIREYWLEKLSGDLEKSFFCYDYKRSSQRQNEENKRQFQSVKFGIPRELCSKIMWITNHSDVKIHIFLVSLAILLLNKYTFSGNNDIIVGTPIYKQDIEGHFINTILVLRNRLHGNMTFKELLYQVRQTIKEATENQNYPIKKIISDLNIAFDEDKDDFPLFDIAILLENIHDKRHIQSIHLNIIFSFLRENDFIEGSIEYNSLMYRKTTIGQIISHFTQLMANVLNNTGWQLSRFDIMPESEKKQLLYDFNNTEIDFPEDKLIHQLFEEQAARTPGNIAISCKGSRLTYGELNSKANRFAHTLRRMGVGPDVIVALMIERSFEMIISILGVLKTGGAYLPIDISIPEDRVAAVLVDCQISLLITKKAILEKYSFASLQQGHQLTGVKPQLTSPRPQIKDLNSIQIPYRSMVNYEKYSRFIGLGMCKNGLSIQATRGCPYQCAYCDRIWPKKHVFRSAENIFEEVRLYYNMGVRRFVFIDDIFNFNETNSSEFFRLIIKNSLDVQLFFPTGFRADLLTSDYMDLMVEAGTVRVVLALETASPRLQKLIRKHLNLEKLHKNAEYFCEKYPNVILELFCMHGFPTETEEEAMKTLDFIKSLKWLHFPHLHILKIYESTDMVKLALESGISREAIAKSNEFAFYELPDTLPFEKGVTKRIQSQLLNDYFLSKERLLHVLPNQMKILTEDEIVKDYNSYLPLDIKDFSHLLRFLKISRDQLNLTGSAGKDCTPIPDLNKKMRESFPPREAPETSLKILLLDLCQFFSSRKDAFNDIVEPPLGLMYLLGYLDRKFGNRINGKIAKSLVDFDNYVELKSLLDQFKPDVIGIRSLNYYKDFFHQTVAAIRQWGIETPIIAGGPYATSSYKKILQDRNVDLAVMGEGEMTFAELIEKIIENGGKLPGEDVLKEIPGIALVPGKTGLEKKLNRHIIIMDALGFSLINEESNENLKHINQSGDLSYVIFTSGSTGIPKGVGVEHKGVVNMLLARKEEYKMDATFTSLQLFPYAFDGFITSVFTPLISGAEVILMAEDEILDIKKVKEIILTDNVSHFISVPEFFKVIIENLTKEEASKLKTVTLAGDKIPSGVLETTKKKNKNIEIINEYGATESSVLSTLYRHQESDNTVKIGKPIWNTAVYILDKQDRIQPIGVPGEMGIAGVGLARGYLNRPELTSERLVPNPFIKGERLYKSGDLAWWLPEGNIEYLGRIDHQVKVRGFRIELEEVENHLLKYEAVKEAVVIAKEKDGNSKLIAYYVEDEIEKNQPELWPSVAEFFIYDDLMYYAMTSDERRNESYRVAIKRAVKDKVVVDIGTGKDVILARFCVEAGAKKVYAVELLEETYRKAKATIERVGLEGKITLIHGDATEIQLPEKADVCVSEIVGPIGGCEGGAVILNKARKLLIEDPIMIPEKSITKIAAAFLPDEIHNNPGFTQIPGEYVKKIFVDAGYSFDLRVCVKKFSESFIISNAEEFENLDFSQRVEEESSHEIILVIHKDSRLDGFLIWLNLHTVKDEIIDILKHEHCWLPVFVPVFYPGVGVMKGDTIKVVCIRTLSENNINPDFKIKGVLLRKNGENIEFEYDLPHFETSFRKSPFYRRLFNEDGSANIVRDSSKKLNGDKLKEHLLKRLPAYMVPADFVQIEKMPLTPNGKIDRRKLDSLAVRPLSYSEIEFIAPQTELEKTIANTWMEVLEVDKVGVDDNFFDIGGNSLKIISLNSKLNAALDMEISIGDLFEYITIRSFIQYLNDKEKNIVFRDIIPIDRAEVLKNVKRNRGDRKAKRKRENLNV